MSAVEIPVSVGELVDKVTILRIKLRHIDDAMKLANVSRELDALERRCRNREISLDDPLVGQLQAVNERLWRIEDDIRECERQQCFDERFIELARAVYHSNDERFQLKSAINDRFNSDLREEKSYRPY